MDFEYRPATGYRPGSPRERLISSVLSLAIILIVILAVIYQGIIEPKMADTRRLVSFSVSAEDPNKTARSSQSRPKAPRVATRAIKAATSQPKPIITIQKRVEKPDAEDGIPGFIHMSKSDLAAADIGKMKGSARGSDGDGKGNDSRTAYGPGEGPGGVQLRRAKWYRKPTSAEMVTYLPKNGQIPGWGLLACRTAAQYHVEDCQILDESPRGAGFGRAVLNASWQFLVVPPKIDGKAQIGTPISILFENEVIKTETAPEP